MTFCCWSLPKTIDFSNTYGNLAVFAILSNELNNSQMVQEICINRKKANFRTKK